MKSFSVLIATVIAVFSNGAVQAAPSQNKITGGSDAAPNQFPYQVSLQWGILSSYKHICGGSIISPDVILTAGHCITEIPNIGSLRIKAGLWKLDDSHSLVQTIPVASTLVHSDYQGGVNPNDIALLKLKSPLSFTEAVQPIALPKPGAVASDDAVLSGWGSISLTIIPSMPNILQTATLPLLSYEECDSALTDMMGSSEPLATTNVCAGPLSGGISACSGDSGGPLVQNGKIIGIVSWGIIPCGSVGAPSVYTQVSSFVNWIQKNL